MYGAVVLRLLLALLDIVTCKTRGSVILLESQATKEGTVNKNIQTLLARETSTVFLVVRQKPGGEKKTMWAGSGPAAEETASMLVRELTDQWNSSGTWVRAPFRIERWRGRNRV